MGGNTRKSKAPSWAASLDAHVKASKIITWSKIAEKLERTEGGVRHWRNGTREISLSEFVQLCEAAGTSPAAILAGSTAPGGALTVEMLPAKEGMLLEVFRGMTPQQQRESTLRMMATVESNRLVQAFVTKPLRTFSNEDVEAAYGKVPAPHARKARGGRKHKHPRRELGTAMDDFLPDE